VSGGVTTYVGTYTVEEDSDIDPVTDESGSQTYGEASNSWTWHDEGLSNRFDRDEAGSFDGSGTTGSYTYLEQGTDSYTWHQSPTAASGFSGTYLSESASVGFTEDSSGTSSYSYSESGDMTPSGTSGTYSLSATGSETFSDTWIEDYDYHYTDPDTSESAAVVPGTGYAILHRRNELCILSPELRNCCTISKRRSASPRKTRSCSST